MRKLDMDRDRWLYEARWLLVALTALAMLFDLFSYDRGHALMPFGMAALAFAALGIALYRGDLCKDRIYIAGLFFVGWYVFTRMFNGDHYVQETYNRYRVVCLLLTYTLALPFAAMQDDAQERRALDRVLLVLVTVLSILVWVSVYAAFTGEPIIDMFGNLFGIRSWDGRLGIINQHPNFTGAISLIGIFGTLYLLLSHWRLWRLVPALVALAGFFVALSLSDSRGAKLAFLATNVILAVVLYQRLRPPMWRRCVIVIACLAAVVGLVLGGTGVVASLTDRSNGGEQAVSQRALLEGVSNMAGRSGIYAAAPKVLMRDPAVLLRGYDELEMMRNVNHYGDTLTYYTDMHNSYLQTLMLTGLPGLVVAVWLTLRLLGAAIKVVLVNDGGVTAPQKLLVTIPIALLVQGMGEHYLFVDSFSILNFVFLLLSGYVIRMGKDITWRQAFPRKAKEQQA